MPSSSSKVQAAFDFAEKQLAHLIEQYPDFFPMYTVDGKWKHQGESWTNWCEGFLGGQLWLIYSRNQQPWWREKAEHYSRLVEHRKTDRAVPALVETLKSVVALRRAVAISA